MPATWVDPPRDWTAGELVTAAIGNQEWRDRMMYLKASPAFTGNPTIAGTLVVTGAVTASSTLGVTGNLTAAALLTVQGFGTHAFSSAGTGYNVISVRNTTGGGGNGSALYLGNDASTTNGYIESYSSTFTSSGRSQADGVLVEASRAGGLSIAATHASGALRFYSGGSTERLTIAAAGGATFSGALAVTGDVAVNTNKFTVTASSGNTLVAGTLNVTGATTLSSTLAVTGNVTVNTDKFTITAASGNTVIAGTLTSGDGAGTGFQVSNVGVVTVNNQATVSHSGDSIGLSVTPTHAVYTSTAVKVNTTVTAAGSGFNLLDLQASGTSQFKVRGDGLVTATGAGNFISGTATPAGGSTAVRITLGSTSGFGVYIGSGAPSVNAAQGSLYLRSDGSSTSTRAYINTDGAGTWTAITTAA